jgi:hypothetical protein
MAVENKPVSPYRIYFIILVILTILFVVLENIYLNSHILEILSPLTGAVGVGVAAYLGTRRKLGHGYKNTDKNVIRGAVLDEYLSREYSGDSKRLTGKNPEIYRMLYPDPLRKWSPAFSVLGKKPRIVVSYDFLLGLQPGEKKALILHEIFHFVHNDEKIIYSLSFVFVLSTGAFVASFVYGIEFGITGLIFLLLSIFASLTVASTVLLKLQLIWQEYRSDKCAAREMGNFNDIKSVIVKASEFIKSQVSNEKYERIETILKRRLKYLE